MKFVVHSLCKCCPLLRLCICKLARYSQGNFVLVTGKVREFYIVRPVGTMLSTLHKLRRTNVIEVNHWAKVANKTANINVQNRSLYAS